MTPIIIALAFIAIGSIVYVLANDKFAELGRASLWAGVFAIVALLCRLL